MTEVFIVVREQDDDYQIIMVCATKEIADTIRTLYIQSEVESFVVMLHEAWARKLMKVGFHSAAPSAEKRETKLERQAIETETRVVRWPILHTLKAVGEKDFTWAAKD